MPGRSRVLAIALLLCAMALAQAIASDTAAQQSVDSLPPPASQSKVDSTPTEAVAPSATDHNTPFRLKDDLPANSSKQSGRSVVNLLLGLVAVLGSIFALAWLSKRFNLNLPGASPNMKLLAALSVGAKEKIILVEVEGSKLLLGVTPQQISLLKNFDSMEMQTQPGEFSDKMLKLMKAGNDDEP